jgi:hypothetical protein
LYPSGSWKKGSNWIRDEPCTNTNVLLQPYRFTPAQDLAERKRGSDQVIVRQLITAVPDSSTKADTSLIFSPTTT